MFDYLADIEKLPEWATEFARELKRVDGRYKVVNGLGEFFFEIHADPERWRRATRTGAFAKRLELGGDSLKRVPSWADPEHQFADDLKRKDFFGSTRLDESAVVAPGFVDEYARICRAAAPLMKFLCDALAVPY